MKRTLALTVTALTLALSVSACGDETDTQDAASSTEQQESGPGGMGRGMQQPGSGKVAALDGSTAQVQSSDSQTAVTWSDSTTFTQQVSAALSDVAEGSCVVVTGEAGDSDDTVTASSVRITEASTASAPAASAGEASPPVASARPTCPVTCRATCRPALPTATGPRVVRRAAAWAASRSAR